jgi:hypothetical protein
VPNYGNGITEGISSTMFPLLSSTLLLLFSSSDDEGGQSSGDNVWGSHSVDPSASTIDKMEKYPDNTRNKIENHLNDGNGDVIYSINRTGQPSIFNLSLTDLS